MTPSRFRASKNFFFGRDIALLRAILVGHANAVSTFGCCDCCASAGASLPLPWLRLPWCQCKSIRRETVARFNVVLAPHTCGRRRVHIRVVAASRVAGA